MTDLRGEQDPATSSLPLEGFHATRPRTLQRSVDEFSESHRRTIVGKAERAVDVRLYRF